MLGSKAVWEQQNIQLADGEYATVASPRGTPNVSLIFLDLPDGNLTGEGFGASSHQSLIKLFAGGQTSIRSVDGQSSYTSGQLITALSMLMSTYQPAEIHTQADVPSSVYPDHSDHIAAGEFAVAAAALYDQNHFGGALTIPVKRYIGYPIHGYTSNITGADLQDKEAAFLAYATYDGGVCHSLSQCAQTPTYGAYISRQYLEDTSAQ
jgi:LmbE family N-acetylglucosaminyl deacetylase